MNNQEVFLADAIDVIEEILASGGDFRLYPKGTSMLPSLRQGKDSVILRRNFECGAKRHDIAFYRRESGAFVLHRVMKIDGDGSYVMCGDNQTELERGIAKEQIIGYVSDVCRGDKRISCGAFLYRVYVFLWCCMPIRKLGKFAERVYRAVKRRVLKRK